MEKIVALLKIIKKNFKLLIRSKSSALIIILGPLLVIFLVGIAFDNLNKFSLSIGTYSEGYTELTDSFITKLEASNFRVQKQASEQECIEQIKQGKINTCIIFPKDLTLDSNKMNEIIFHVDNSKINLVWMVLETISSTLAERSSELSLDLTTELLKKVDFTKTELYETRPKIVNLKTESRESVDTIGVAIGNLNDLRTQNTDLQADILLKISGAENAIDDTKTKISKLNTSSEEKESLETKLNELGTYLYNLRGKVESQSNTSVPEFTQMENTLNAIGSNLNSIRSSLLASNSDIESIQESVNRIYEEMNNLQITNATTIVNPITTRIKPVTTEKSYLNYLFPSLVILVIMFISILLSNTLVMMEKHSPAYFRNFITPTRDIIFILATYLTNVSLVFLQLLIILGISASLFKAQVLTSIPMTALILLLVITFFTFVGMIIGYLFNSEETATLAAISIGAIFLFLSNVILPLETMPETIRHIASFNPFVLGESLLRKAIIFQAGFQSLYFELLVLLGYSLVLFFIIWIFQRAVRKHLGHKISYRLHKRKKKKAKKVKKSKK